MTEPAWTPATLNDPDVDPHHRPDKPARVRSMFAAIAGSYDLNNRLHSFGRDQAWRRATVRLAGPRAGERVLDCACGTGDLTLLLADAVRGARGGTLEAGQVVGSDFTAEMLDHARAKAAGRRGEGVTWELGDATALTHDDASFDVVTIAFGLRNVSDPVAALREFRRVLRPGGRLVVLEFAEPTNPLVRWGDRVYRRRVMPWTATLIARDRSGAYRYLPKSVQTFWTPGELRDAMAEAGFADATSRAMTFGVAVATRGVVGAGG